MAAGRSPTLIWHTYPLGLLGADQTGADRTRRGSLRDLVGWLPHVTALGADTLLLGPVFSSLSHGYDTRTHREVDDRLGTTADLDALVAAAGAAGIGVVLDGAFAYASRSFWRLGDPDETGAPWFRRDTHGDPVPWRVDALVTPDHDAPGYQAYVADVLASWLDRGVAGWRLDSAWSVPAPFWRRVLARVRRTHPDAWFLGQVFDDDLPPVVNRATYSSATEYALMHGTREWLAGGPVEGMVSTLGVHRANSTRAPVHTFLGNHDFARLADVVDADLLPAAFAVLMTLPGVPGVYYGDELGVRSPWTAGGSDAVLRPHLPVPAPGAPAGGLLDAVRRLGAFRRARPWLTRASLDAIRADGDALAYTVRGGGGEAVHVHVNPSPAAVTLPGAAGRHVLGAGARPAGPDLHLAPRGWAVLA